MANLEFCDKHNMVAYLKKPTGSEGFQEIVDFLNGSHIRYDLTTNPTIYVSLIEKFWQTATVKTVDNGEQEITTIVDGKEFTVTEASVRRHLKLADVEAAEGLKPISMYSEAVYEEWDDKVGKATTTAASLDAAQASEIQGLLDRMEFGTEVYTAEDVSTAGAAVTTAGASISTASPPRVSTAEDISTAETLVYIRRSAAKYKEKLMKKKGKRITGCMIKKLALFNIKEWEDMEKDTMKLDGRC
ncbi:hypothetical protein Tco_0739247 [Tanacetum coccineum]